jgi:hypothetical protein
MPVRHHPHSAAASARGRGVAAELHFAGELGLLIAARRIAPERIGMRQNYFRELGDHHLRSSMHAPRRCGAGAAIA